MQAASAGGWLHWAQGGGAVGHPSVYEGPSSSPPFDNCSCDSTFFLIPIPRPFSLLSTSWPGTSPASSPSRWVDATGQATVSPWWERTRTARAWGWSLGPNGPSRAACRWAWSATVAASGTPGSTVTSPWPAASWSRYSGRLSLYWGRLSLSSSSGCLRL